jgi:uncharacterized membrane protein required for colicin V production
LDLDRLTTVDALVLGACVVFAVRGAVKGFAWQAMRTLALLGALYGASLLADDAEDWLARSAAFLPEFSRPVVAWVGMALLVFFAFAWLANLARGAVRSSGLNGADRALGLVFGAAMGLVFAAVAVVLWGGFRSEDEDLAEAMRGSRSVYGIVQVVEVVPLVPRSTRERWRAVLARLEAEER